jgi:uncharacterized protein (TIGR04255 family)
MSATLAQSGRFDPIHAAHAIEQVVFVVQFDPPLDESQLLEIRNAALQFKSEKDLPGQMEVQEFAIAFGSPGAEAPPPPPRLPIGLVLQSTGRDGSVENNLRVERASLTFRTTLYTRWDTVWTQASRYFETLLPKYAQYSQLATVSLNYVDKFVWTGPIDQCSPNLLLHPQSKYVCPHVYEVTEFWHSHTGKFIRTDAYTKRLLNVNVDYLEETSGLELRRVVAVTTVLTDMLNQSGYSSTVIAKEDVLEFVEGRMQKLHTFGKEVLSDIINTEMGKRIALIG